MAQWELDERRCWDALDRWEDPKGKYFYDIVNAVIECHIDVGIEWHVHLESQAKEWAFDSGEVRMQRTLEQDETDLILAITEVQVQTTWHWLTELKCVKAILALGKYSLAVEAAKRAYVIRNRHKEADKKEQMPHLKVFFRWEDGRTKLLKVSTWDTPYSIQDLVERKTGYRVARISHRGKELNLEDNETIVIGLGLTDGCHIDINGRLRGGAGGGIAKATAVELIVHDRYEEWQGRTDTKDKWIHAACWADRGTWISAEQRRIRKVQTRRGTLTYEDGNLLTYLETKDSWARYHARKAVYDAKALQEEQHGLGSALGTRNRPLGGVAHHWNQYAHRRRENIRGKRG